jgi:hypothetical protein
MEEEADNMSVKTLPWALKERWRKRMTNAQHNSKKVFGVDSWHTSSSGHCAVGTWAGRDRGPSNGTESSSGGWVGYRERHG